MHQDVSHSSPVPAPGGTVDPGIGVSWRPLFQGRGGWALADQAVVSLGNCLSGIILVSALSLQDFGVFTLVFGVVLFLNGLHQSLVTYPLSVRGAATDDAALRRLAGAAALFTLALALPLGLAVALMAAALHRASLIPWILAAMLLWQIQETLRRAIMAHLRHREAVIGDAARYLGQALVLLLIARRGLLTLELAFAGIAATSLLAALLQAFQLRPAVASIAHARGAMSDWWTLGRWVLLTNGITIVTVQAMPWALGAFHGSGEVAKFGALALVMGLTNPVVLGIGGLVIPAVAGAAATHGTRAASRMATVCGLQGAALLLPYYAAVCVVPQIVIGLFTRGNPAYAGLGTELRLFALAYALVFPAQIAGALLNGLGRSRASFIAQSFFSIATLCISLPLAAAYGLSGAVWGGILPAVAYLAASLVLLRRVSREDVSAAPRIAPSTTRPPAPGEAGLIADGVAA